MDPCKLPTPQVSQLRCPSAGWITRMEQMTVETQKIINGQIKWELQRNNTPIKPPQIIHTRMQGKRTYKFQPIYVLLMKEKPHVVIIHQIIDVLRFPGYFIFIQLKKLTSHLISCNSLELQYNSNYKLFRKTLYKYMEK